MKRDIENLDDIKLLVDSFYGHIQKDELLGPIFGGKITDWSVHLEKMYTFWQTILLEEFTYHGAPFPPHAVLPIEQQHFDQWLNIWRHTVDGFFEGDRAQEAKWRGERMATMFMSKLSYLRANDLKPLT